MTDALQLRPLGKTLGTEAIGVDLSKLDDATFAWIESVFAEHPVLVFRNQHLAAEDLAAFGRRFGTPRVHSLVNYRYPGVPEVSWLRKVDDAGNIDWYGVKRATDWHTDSTYEEVPPLLAMLHALDSQAGKAMASLPPLSLTTAWSRRRRLTSRPATGHQQALCRINHERDACRLVWLWQGGAG